MTTAYEPQTTAETMNRIEAGVDPWIAYRDFLEDWTYIPESRGQIAGPRPIARRTEDRPWAALLAATVEALCSRDGVPIPAWTQDRVYCLEEPWYLYEGKGRIREWIAKSTPEAFARRNIWSGDRLLDRT